MPRTIPENLPAKDFIDYVNMNFTNDAQRSRILLGELLKRIERLQKNMDSFFIKK